MWVRGERTDAAPFAVREVGPIGAGDAFAAGYLASSLRGGTPQDRCAPPTAWVPVREHAG